MNRAFLIVECDAGWCVVPADTPDTTSLDENLKASVRVSWPMLRAYSKLTQALFHLRQDLEPAPSRASEEG